MATAFNQLARRANSLYCKVDFEWDRRKADENQRKHGVSFAEASTVFGDTFAVTFDDPDHSASEHRSITVGMSGTGRLLIVAHAERGTRIRLISARTLTPSERRAYEEETH